MTGPVVYVLVDATDAAIYVGASRDYGRRLTEHQRKPYWESVAAAEVYPMADWETALHVERNLIRALSPEFNRQSVEPTTHAINRFMGAKLRDLAEVMK